MVRSMEASRQVGAGAIALSYSLIHWQRERHWGWRGLLKTQPTPGVVTPSNKHMPSNFSVNILLPGD